ncbi:MAG: hypothetical protein FWG66_05025 [Spirochaetes bacterium]|nr:hypothetical protein [Spirochaetota bacterium]
MKVKPGDDILLEDGRNARVVSEIGDGAQGVVYKVQVDGKEYALKLYKHFSSASEKEKTKKNLKDIIRLEFSAEQFIMPKVITHESNKRLGYLMDMLPQSFSSFPDYLNGKVRFGLIEKKVLAGINLVNAFRALHRKGYNYKDLNDGNFFINTDTGEVRIIDSDNISSESGVDGIQGTPGYMAPEIVRGEKGPSVNTDRHSLAVVLFKLFIVHDPFQGKLYHQHLIMGPKEQRLHYGENPVFIYHKDNASNRPKEGVDKNPIKLWPLFPSFFKDRFHYTFVQGLKNPNARNSDDTWQKALIQLRDEISICTLCEKEFLWSIGKCGCGYEFDKETKRLNIGLYNVPIFPGQKLYACHIAASGDYDLVIGRIQAKKNDSKQLVIKNLSGDVWTYRSKLGETIEVKKDALIPLQKGIGSILLKDTEAVIGSKDEKTLHLIINSYELPLYSGQNLMACHTVKNGSKSVITGEIKSKKSDPNSFAVKNLSDDEWIVSSTQAKKVIKKGEMAPIRAGLTINFKNDILGKIKLQ